MTKRVERQFYTQPTLTVAKDLLGKYLVRRIGKKRLIGKIVETEAYIGPEDKASHAFLPRRDFRFQSNKDIKRIFGNKLLQDKNFLRNLLRGGGKITERNKAEYLEGGHIYIYLVYGMYWQLNISTSKKGRPECALIRALEPIIKIKNQISNIKNTNQNSKTLKLANGPGKLCRWMNLDKSFYGEDLVKSKRIWLTKGGKIKPSRIVAAKRIGIDYAGPKWAAKKWRFYIKDNFFVSRKHNNLTNMRNGGIIKCTLKNKEVNDA